MPRRAEVNPNATNPAAMHPIKLGGRGLLIDDGHAPSSRTQLLDRVQHAGIVGAVDARLNDNHAVEMQRAMHLS